ncbi:FadR/GntR family transcriptional regulator [Planomicrobium sp. YIM 101495]|uniref:FadR/GntR family transcriptional regulator n=1 Tax=Planomicrobium sp. YIM 101495 TaxID=2665160 RepID=UPI0018AC3EE6|nr:FadR/GntR family transcriptional regulator [Planomicrobium sp. YIM 101495]
MAEKKKTYEIVLAKIEQFFLEGELAVGDKLPPERELAKEFGVSRTSVRDALQVLELAGKIETRQGGGSFIRTTEVASLKNDLGSSIAETEEQLVMEMLELRMALELESARLAAARRTPEQMATIQAAVAEMEAAVGDVERGIQADLSFHLAISEASGNRLLQSLMQKLSDRMEDTIRATRTHRLLDDSRFLGTVDEHRQIGEAIRKQSPELARELMEGHLKRITEEIEQQ